MKFEPPDLDSTGILAQAASERGWSKKAAADAETWYKRFLELCYDNPGASPPILTGNADYLWHTHITFTLQYTNYCQAILGYYLHHLPELPRRKPTAGQVVVARKAYRKKWGTALARIITPDMIVQCKP